MNLYQYHSERPRNNKTNGVFTSDDQINFEFDSNGRSLVKNSIELSATLTVKSGAGQLVAQNIGFNPSVGAHVFFESFSCSTINQGNVENFSVSYPRYVNMEEVAKYEDSDYMNASKWSELKVPDFDITQNLTKVQSRGPAGSLTTLKSLDFCIKPRIIFNRSSQDVPFSRTGKMKITCNLATAKSALVDFSTAASVADLSYELSNVQMYFRTVPAVKNSGPIQFSKVIGIKTTIDTTSASIASNVPSSACSGVVMSFQPLSTENKAGQDNYRLFNPHVSSCEFLFNSTNSYINYQLKDQSEIVMRALKAFQNDGDDNQMKLSNMFDNKNMMVGTDFNGLLDLTQNQFEIQLNTAITETNNVYMYFLCLSSF